MRLTIDLDGTAHEVDVTQVAHHATLGDLLYAVTGTRLADDEDLWVDEHPATPADKISDLTLLEGSRISRLASETLAPAQSWTAVLAGGMDAGLVIEVPSSRVLAIGRSPQADITVDSPSASWAHCTIERDGTGVRVRDSGSTNGTVVDGTKVESDDGVHLDADATIQVGGATIALRRDLAETVAPRPGSLPNVTPSGTVPFNRPPRPGRPPEPDGVVPPERKDISPVSKLNIFTILGPLVMAVVMVVLMKNIRYAAFAVLSPLLGLGTWFEQKRRRAKEVLEEEMRFARSLTEFQADLAKAADVERQRRNEATPDPAVMLRRAALPATRLWQRRFGDEEFLRLHAGIGNLPWRPPIAGSDSHRLPDAVREIVDAATIPAAPIEVDLTAGGVVGIVGERRGALALARSLVVQAGTHCGPADLTIGVYCDKGREDQWEWSTWLPHTRRLGDSSGDRWVSADRSRSEAQLRGLRESIDGQPTPAMLLVLDSEVLTEGREAPARMLLGHGRRASREVNRKPETQVSGIVIAGMEEQLPASCTLVITVADDAAATVSQPGDLARVDGVTIAGISVEAARQGAMHLARFDDPELVIPGSALPSLVRFPPLLDVDEFTPEVVADLWANSPGVSAPIGIGEDGVFTLDLVRDGPHGLVGGTTGSGKSEFLRSMVAGLAACNDPTTLSFILIDFKGGAAFTACERLPHTIGTVSNLDEQLADRAIRALEAEMGRRQRAFAAAGEGVDNLKAYLATNPAEPMPRLLLVIDEFAMLAKDYPDVLSSLVSVGAVGRTLGVHMILATQRPAGVVNDDILANTNLRVALRVQSKDDSINVIGVPTASAIGRNQQGRAFIKLGQDDITPVQTALVTGSAQENESEPVELRPVTFGAPVQVKRAKSVASKQTDLDLLIDAIVAAGEAAGIAPPRKVWPEALGERVALAGFGGDGGEGIAAGSLAGGPQGEPSGPDEIPLVGAVNGSTVSVGLADDPDHQRQIAAGWDMDRGNLLLLGIPGSGTSTTLATIALTLAAARDPKDLDILILDMGSRDLAPLGDLPHAIGYAGSGSASMEQQQRLLKFVRAELDRRRVEPGPHRDMLILIDGLAALKDEYQDFDGLALLDGLYRAYADGPDVGMHFAATASRVRAVASAIDEVTTQKWLFRLADPYDYSAAGIKPQQAPSATPGRCVFIETKLQTHIATPACGLENAIEAVRKRWSGSEPKTSVVRQLPNHVSVRELRLGATLTGEPWRIPIGLRESDLEPAVLELYENEHMLVAGPVRSGKSTTLLAIAQTLREAAGDGIAVWGVCQRRSPLLDSPLLDRLSVGDTEMEGLCGDARTVARPIVVLIDDAEQLSDPTHEVKAILDANLPNLHIIVAGRSDDLRSDYSHWSKPIRKARCGVLLQPNLDFDGDLLGAALPRRIAINMTQGRGFACTGGITSMIQAASPD